MTQSTYYNIYLNNNIELVSTMIIKLDIVANAMNRELIDLGLEVSEDKLTWRYYKHLSGNYHSADTIMYVKSLDTGETIAFNINNLKHHKKTKALYRLDPNYILELIKSYPSQYNLIKGIMCPILIEEAVNSNDGTILYYDSKYVETQELNLIYDGEEWIRSYLYRVSMQAYDQSDDLFAATVCGLLYANLPNVFMDIRLKYIKTSQVHTFHISRYLASYNHLDDFMNYLTFEQQLFLYMNIDYIVRHTGMCGTYELLLDKLLTIRNLPVFDYTLRQSSIPLSKGKLQPVPVFSKDKLNLNNSGNTRLLDLRDIRSVIYKEASQTTDNLSMASYYEAEAIRLTEQSSISKIPTKIVEVSAIDPDDAAPVKLIELLINEWAYHATAGSYVNTIEIINPLNGDPLKLTVSDAFLLFLYGYAKGMLGIELDEIPIYCAYNVAKTQWISESEYLKIVPDNGFGKWDRDIDFFINSNLVLTENIAYSQEFMDRCSELASRRNTRYQWVENKFNFEDRVGAAALYNYSYMDVWCKLDTSDYKTYDSYFLHHAINPQLIDGEMWKDIAVDCLDKATDFTSSSNISLRDIQSSMVNLFKRLSSYTIQFLEEIASDDAVIANSVNVIPGDIHQSVTSFADVQNLLICATEYKSSATFDIHHINTPTAVLYVDYDDTVDVDAEIGVDAFCSTYFEAQCTVTLGKTKVIEL